MPDRPIRPNSLSGPRSRTARQEQAARLQAELEGRFRHTHDYSPDVIGLGRTRITPGAPIQILHEHNRQMNAGVRGWSRRFATVRDAEGNIGTIARGELAARGSYQARPEPETVSPDAMRWNPEVGEKEMGLWEGIFRDRRGERE